MNKIVTRTSLLFRLAMLFGRFVPLLRVEQARVGQDTTTYFRIWLG